MIKHLEELKKMLEKEIDKLAQGGDISVSSLEKMHKLTDTYKNLCKIYMLDEEGGMDEDYEGGSSYRRGRGRNARRDSMGRYAYGGGYSEEGYSERRGGMMPYDGGSSYERGGQGGSSYRRGGSSYEGYSRDGAKDYMLDKIEEMMEQAQSPKERKALQECMKNLENA
jgi:hypothetical protein